jgi:tetratricopeptide (TPR) repeat protein
MSIYIRETCLIVLLLGCQGKAQINPTPTPEQLRAAWQKDPTKAGDVPFGLLADCDPPIYPDPECNHPVPQLSGSEMIFAPHMRHRVPKEAKKAFQRALVISHTADHRAARKEFERAIRLDPEFAEAYGNVAIEYAATGSYEIAEARFKRAIELDPASSIVYCNLGVLLAKVGRLQDAEAAFRRSLDLAPGNANAHFLLGRMLLSIADNSTEAEKHLKYAAQTIPSAKKLLKNIRRERMGTAERQPG